MRFENAINSDSILELKKRKKKEDIIMFQDKRAWY